MRLVTEREITNTLGVAESNYEKGLHQVDDPNAIANYATLSGNWSVYGCVTNGVAWSVADTLRIGNVSVMFDHKCPACTEDHVSDYPKVSKDVMYVQRMRRYAQILDVDGERKETLWERYDYPYKKVTTTTTRSIVIKEDTETEIHDIDHCKCRK